jgi:lactose/L-arabinose transport system ATP-binding protein
MTLADKIVVLRAGRVEQVGAPLDLYNDPDNQFVAGFIGSPAMNFFAGEAGDGGLKVPGLGPDMITGPRSAWGKVTVGIRPNHLELAAGDSHIVDLSEHLGGVSYHHLKAPDGSTIIVEARDQQTPKPGSKVGITFDPAQAYFFNAENGLRLR